MHALLDHIFQEAPGDALVAIADNRFEYRYVPLADLSLSDTDCFFGPVVRKTPGSTKVDCLGTAVLWADVDRPQLPVATLPPSAVVHSGHGWHLYWKLRSYSDALETIESVGELLAKDVNGDPVWNVNRVMRIPGTWNRKEDPPVICTLRNMYSDRVYALDDLNVLRNLDEKTRRKIRTGDRRGYASRSERDMSIFRALVNAGASDELVKTVFLAHKCGDKYREEKGARYMTHSLKAIRDRQKQTQTTFGIVETSNGFAIAKGTELRPISTFVFEPMLLLEGEDGDAIVGDMKAYGYTWPNVLLPRRAFNQTQALLRYLPMAAWQWLGNDADVRRLLPYLLERLRLRGLPRVRATHVLGRHKVAGEPYFVTSKGTLSADGLLQAHEAPIAYFPLQRATPVVKVDPTLEPPADLIDALRCLNRPEVIWPVLGWWAATALKPALADIGVRFPILNITGTRGSGKTTTIKRVMMPMFGDVADRTYNASSTRFVLLTLLASSNAVPIALSEFRQSESSDNLTRYILLLYDTGYDPRGRQDQTTVDYPLIAPLCIDGEDIVSDPAVRERSLVVNMSPEDIAEGSLAYTGLIELEELALGTVAGAYLQYSLSVDVGEVWNDAFDAIHAAFPARLPDRVRRNLAVAYFGLLVFHAFCDEEPPPAIILNETLQHVFATSRGRAPMAADDFIESLVAAVSNTAKRQPEFFFWYDEETNVLWFNLTSAHKWWQQSRRSRLGVSSLGREAIQSQLAQLLTEYMESPTVVRDFWCFGVRLASAVERGLDVPGRIDLHTIRITYRGGKQ